MRVTETVLPRRSFVSESCSPLNTRPESRLRRDFWRRQVGRQAQGIDDPDISARGLRKLSANEADGIRQVEGVALVEVAATRLRKDKDDLSALGRTGWHYAGSKS